MRHDLGAFDPPTRLGSLMRRYGHQHRAELIRIGMYPNIFMNEAEDLLDCCGAIFVVVATSQSKISYGM